MTERKKINEAHLQNIQAAINRLASVSFAIKGWSVTLVTAMFAISAKDANVNFVIVAYFPALIFWFLDAYYLGMERRFVKMYNESVEGRVTEHEIKPHNFTGSRESIGGALFSRTIFSFHGGVVATIIFVMFFILEF